MLCSQRKTDIVEGDNFSLTLTNHLSNFFEKINRYTFLLCGVNCRVGKHKITFMGLFFSAMVLSYLSSYKLCSVKPIFGENHVCLSFVHHPVIIMRFSQMSPFP